MFKQHSGYLLLALLITGMVSGCNRSPRTAHAQATDYFKTHWQDESQFIVETISADLAEQVYYAKFHKVPAADSLYVSATETPDSTFATPTYDLEIDLDAKHAGLKNRLNINGPIWSPEVYDGLISQLAKEVGLPPGANEESKDTALLAKLTDGQATTIERENQEISSALNSDFTNPTLHEQAALLLGAFTLREHSGNFFEVRSPLCRITSHLAMARYLGGADFCGINGNMARVMLLTLMNNQADALQALKSIPTNDAALVSWTRALRARNTDDYRPLDQLDGLSPIECIEWFQARERSGNKDFAWSKLSDEQKKTADFLRIANQSGYSVGVGRQLLELSMTPEYREISDVYNLSQGEKMTGPKVVEALNQMPDRCFSIGPDHQMAVHVIGWGQWAGFLQRHLCHAIQQNFYFLQRAWGVPDEAHSFSTNMDTAFSGLRLYPLVRRFNAVSVDDYHQAVDDGFKVTVATPQLVLAECWNYLCYDLDTGESYRPNPNPHVNEWHKHNPPPGTAYDIYPRLNHPSLTGRADATALMDELHERAPYDGDIADYIYKNIYHKKPTYAQAEALYSEVLAYKPGALVKEAATVKDQPVRYEMLLKQAAEIDPSEYFTLADYFADLKQDDKAAAYLEKGGQLDPNSLMIASRSTWLVRYYLKNARTNDARTTADFAGEVYSFSGLEAKAIFLEETGDYAGAYEWYANIQDRYDDYGPLLSFCLRYKNKTGGSRFDVKLQDLSAKIFPAGIEKVSLGDFKSAPVDGVLVGGDDDNVQAAGMKQGDVIVALNGVWVHNFVQYQCERDLLSGPVLDLIVWQGNGYHEIKASPPDHLFGVDFFTYPRKN